MLGPIFQYLTSKSTAPITKASAKMRAIAQSYQIIGGLLHYRSLRDIGIRPIREGWVVAVPDSLQTKVIVECHSDGCHGDTGIIKIVWAIRKKYFFM